MPDHWLRFTATGALGSILLAQKRYGEAETSLLDSYQGLSQRQSDLPPEERQTVLDLTRHRIVDLYLEWDKPDAADRWKAEL